MDKSEAVSTIRELAAATSAQAQVTNRTWFAVMTIAIVGGSSRVGADGRMALPFGLGTVAPDAFHLIAFFMLSVMVVAFCAAHIQQIRTQDLAERELDKLAAKGVRVGLIHPRELLDMLRVPSVLRVAPLAQALRGEYQFDSTQEGCPAWRFWLSTFYYLILKCFGMLIYLGIPAVSLHFLKSDLGPTEWTNDLNLPVLLIAYAALAQTFISEFIHLGRTLERVCKGKPEFGETSGGTAA